MLVDGCSKLLLGGLALVAGCTAELDHSLACGDGYVDALAGEECEPLVPATFATACREERPDKPEGEAGCHPETCTFELSGCALCGDGHVDPGEECDTNNFDGHTCPIGLPGLRCTSECRIDASDCPTCGNGTRDPGEECDYNDVGGLGIQQFCAGTSDSAPLKPPKPELPYTYGETTVCNETCQFDRSSCSYCGNGRIQDAELIDGFSDIYSLPEVCDGDQRDVAELMAQFGGFCFQLEGVAHRPNVGCASNCLAFADRPDEPTCCVSKGERCPVDTAPFQCCYQYDHPGEDACEETVDSANQYVQICR